jgi:hypothetical protein
MKRILYENVPKDLFPITFGIEIFYTFLIVFFCFLIFYKTREVYILTKHKGIKYFRFAFMFFGIAFASRLVLYLMKLNSDFFFANIILRQSFRPISIIIITFFSTMAIFYLTYSIIWKKFDSEQFLMFANITALIVSIIAFTSHSPLIISFMQLIIMIASIIIIFINHKNQKKKVGTKSLYALIYLIWFISLLILHSKWWFSFEIKLIVQTISIAVFTIIYFKVAKWLK